MKARQRKRIRLTLIAAGIALLLSACGGEGDQDAPATSTPSASSPTTVAVITPASPATTAPASGRASNCAALGAEAVDLFNRWRNDMRGVAGPQNEAGHRAEASALAEEARRLGCPIPASIEQVING